jgi:hypothetical protein
VTGIFKFVAAPVPLFDDLPGGYPLLICLIAAAVALWPRER